MLFMSCGIIEDVLVAIFWKGKKPGIWRTFKGVSVGVLKITDNLTLIFEIQVYFV